MFLLAVNVSELAHSIKAVYGQGFDAKGYLNRFFDVGFRLPTPYRKVLIDASFDALHIEEHLARLEDQTSGYDFGSSQNMIYKFLGAESVSARTVLQTLHHFRLTLASLGRDRPVLLIVTTALLVLRALDRDLYYKFIHGQVSDLDVVKALTPDSQLEETWLDGAQATFEAMIIIAFRENSPLKNPDGSAVPTPLWESYLRLAETSEESDEKSDQARAHAGRVLQIVNSLSTPWGNPAVGFKAAVQRIELLSPELTFNQR